jgi:ribonucleoside-diphosphate reductase alpha chain
MRMGGGIGYDFCVSPDTKILTSNLDWVKAEDLTIGQELVGFSENLNLQKNKFKPAFVESNKSLIAEIIDVLTDKNSTKVSADHLFVVLRKKDFPHKKKGKGYKWVKARDLKEGDKIAFISKPWDIDEWKTYDAGWFAGMMDGEGWCVSQTTKTGGSKTHSGLAQNVGKVNDKILELLTKYEIPNKSYRYTNPNAIFESHRFRGTWAAARLIGICKPIRFNPKKIWEGAKLSTRSNPSATVITTKSLGAGKVFAVKTSTKTLIADGFLGHNSNLRPKGANIVTLESPASGPISFMKIYDAVCATVKSAGSRRGAQMGILNCNHPDIEEFVRAKQNTDQLTNFNISIGVYDDFMKAVFENKTYDLIFNDQIYKTIDAKALWEEIMRSTWDWAEPGVLFLDKINEYNNLWYCEDIHATNPCGEVPLPPFGTCLLGSVNLVKYITPNKVFDWDTFIADIPAIVRALDNVIDRTIYPLKEYEREQKNKRRMGIGITGLANAGEALGYPYATDKFLEFTKRVMKTLRNECYLASIDLAKEKGSFPLFDKDKFVESKFIKRLPKQIQEAIYEHGIRNSHLLSVAPTGTISLSADNVSSGIEPVFAHEYSRTIITEDGPVVEPVKDYGVNVFGVKGRTTDDISALEHLNVLTTVQYYVDQACSKTINVGDNVSWEDFKEIYKKAWQNGAKGVTTFRASGKRMGILNKTEKQPVTACLNGACEI